MLCARRFLLGILGFALSACGVVGVEYSSFSALESLNEGDSFYIQPNDAQATSIEFNHYATSIARRLSSKGWHRVLNPDDARYIVLFDYGISGSSTQVGSVPIYGQTGSVSYAGSPYATPTYGIVSSQVYSVTQHQGYFQINVIEKASGVSVYELKSTSESELSTFGQIAECVFDITLENFPIQLATSEVTSIDECGK